MIPFPLQAGQMGMNRSTTVAFRAAGTMLILNAVTSISPVAPAVSVGDLLVAVVMRRSAPASDPPAGWQLVSTAGPATEGSINQYTHVYTKVATASDSGATFTFQQASSGRMIAQILGAFTTNGTPAVVLEGNAKNDSVNTNAVAFPSVAVAVHGNLAIAVGSISISNTSPATTTLSGSGSWTLASSATVADNRMGIFYQAGVTSTAGTMTSSTTAALTATTSNVIVLAPPF